jgi:hypothetical protein
MTRTSNPNAGFAEDMKIYDNLTNQVTSFRPMFSKGAVKNSLTSSVKRHTIREPINYRSVPGTIEPAFACLADLQDPPHKWHGFRIFAHNPEVTGSNPVPATVSETTRNGRFWF